MQKISRLSAIVALLSSLVLVQTSPAQNVGTARVNGAPQINSGRVEGNVQQMTGANVTLNSGAVLTGDLLVPGTPTLIKNGTMNFGGTIVGTGSTSPSNYQVILNGSITLGHLRTRTNPVAIPALSPVPAPTGTRTVTITAAGQSAGNFATLRNLTLNGNVGQYAIPAGTYGDFIANGGSGFTLGVAGATQAAVYNFQHFTLNGQTNIIVLGPVVINVANGFTANGTAGTSTNPAWLKLNIVAGGFTLNGGCNIYGYVNAPGGTVIINGATKLVGGCISAGLIVNANGLLQLFDATSFENNPPAVAITSPAAGAVFNAGSAITLVASATDPGGSVAKVEFFAGTTKLGEATSSPWTYTWQNAVAGPYQLTAIATDNLGAKTTSSAVSISVNAPPTVGLTAPANQSVFQAGSVILLTANAADSDGTIQKVEFFSDGTKLGEKTSAPYSFSWTNALTGPHALTARAIDNNGAQTISATVNIRVNATPTVALTAPANGSVVQAGSTIPLAASASDSDGTITKVEFYAGATKVGEDTSSPYQLNWSNAPAGQHSLTAKATDNDGAQTISATVSVRVNAAPVATMSAPANGSVVQAGSVIPLAANTSDSDGTITKVEFYAGATKVGEDTTAPYQFNWSNAALGQHSLTAKATDNDGAQTISATVSIRVNAAPVATMSAPANGSVVQAGSVIPLAANASDSDGTITKVEFYAGATKVGEDTSSPYQFNWNNAPAGQHSLTARAIDNDGAQGTSAPVILTINAPPAVAITAPAAAQVFNPGATISITASSSDPDGTVTKVEFFSGTTKIGEAGVAPWTISWPAPVSGVYQLSAKATDNLGAYTTSSIVSIRINAPPAVTITAPANQAVAQPGNPILLTVNTSDSDGTITKVEFFAGGTKLGESSSAPFNFSWTNPISGSYTLTAKATDNDAASTISAPTQLRVNALPAVALTAPAQGATFRTGEAIPVSANATDSDDGITKVEFFAGSTKIGEASTTPYSISWVGAPTGASILTARATDGSGAIATSAAVTIDVTQVNSQITVDAGPDRLISLPGAATLEGQVLLNGSPAGPEVALEWSLVSGPGAVTFSAPNSSTTSASFTQAGNYIIRLTASNIDGANFDTTAVAVLAAPQADPDSPISNQGREFWMAFLSNPTFFEPVYSGGNLTITSETAATGTVEIFESYQTDGDWQVSRQVKTFSVEAGGKTIVAIHSGPPDYRGQFDQARSTSVHIVADAPVAIHALNYLNASTDGSLILPTSLLGLDHFVMSYRNNGTGPRWGTECAVVATKPQTSVTITPSCPTGAHPAGQPFTVTLQTGEVYRLIALQAGNDLTGTRIQADKPVAVYGGHGAANVPFNVPYADHLYEQIPSVDLWGRHFLTVPLRGRTGGDFFRLLASNDNTHVSINGQIVATLNRGQFYETILTQPASILADQRILVAQFAQGSEADHTTGDPFLSLVPPSETFGRHYIMPTPYFRNYDFAQHHYVFSDIFDSYLTVVVDSAHAADVRVDGQPIDPAQFFPIADSGFSGASILVQKNSTVDVSSPTPIGTLLYGWAPYESYGFTGGLYGSSDSAAAQFTLTQSASAAPVGSAHRVRAQLINSAGLTVPDAHVSFSVIGANPTSGSGLTAPDGSVEFSWQGTQAGVDTVTATSGVLSATVSVTWVAPGANQPPQVNAGSDVLVAVGQPLALHGVVQDDGHPGGTITLQWSAMPGPGDVTFADPTSADTTATFAYPGQYRLRLTAYDGQFAGDDDLLVTVDIPPAFIALLPSSDVVDAGKQWTVGVSAVDRDGLIARIELIEGNQVLDTLEPNDQSVSYYYTILSTIFTTTGPHSLTVRLTDDQGATADRSLTVIVRPAPVAQILSPADNTTLAAGESASFTASASSAGGPIVRVVYSEVSNYQYEIGDGTGSDYQFTWTPGYAGTFLIAATAYDSEGASGTSAPITITVLSPGDPTLTITSPANGTSVYPGQTLTVHADATAVLPAEVNEVNFFDGYQYLGSRYSPPFEVQWTPYGVGSHTLTAYVYDTFGGFAETSVTIEVVEPPGLNITLVEPAPNIQIKVNTPTTVTADIANVIGTLEEVYFYANGEWLGGGSSNSVSWTPTAVGDYQIEVYAYSYGPYQTGYVVTNVTVADLHSPGVEWIAPANNTSFAPNTPIVLQAQASDIDSNLAKLQFIADGQLLSETPLSGGAGVASCTWENAGPGWHALTALAVDDTIQSNGALLRVFVERTVANDLLPPSALTSETTSASTIHLAWSPSISSNATVTVIERRAGMNGVWEEIAVVDRTATNYEDSALEPETYYSYRLAALDASGARSNYSTESSATTKVQLPQYAVVDLGESLEQSFVALNVIEKGFLYAKANDMFPSAAVLELKDADVMSIDEANNVLLKKRDITNGQVRECYFLWHPDDRPPSNPHPPDSICDPHFRAFRLSRDGVVAGAVDHSTVNPSAVPDWIYRGLEFWSGIGSRPGTVHDDGTRIDVRAATWTAAGGVHELVPADEREYRYDRLDIQPPRMLPSRFDSNFSAWDVSTNGTVVGTGSWSDLRGIDPSTPLETFSSYESFTFPHGMRWKNGNWDTLGSLRQQSSSEGESIATAVNPLGTIVVGGSAAPDRSGDPTFPTHAMRSRMLFGARPLEPGDPALEDLAPLGTGSYSWAWDVDANGNAVGYSTKGQSDPISRTHAVLWKSDSTAALELPNLGGRDPTFFPDGYGYAHAINATGDRIVGKSITQDIFTAGTVWALNANNGGGAPTSWEVHDLNAHVPSDWFVVNALDVNNKGFMVGTAFHTVPNPADPQGQPIQVRRGVLLIPVEFLEVTPKTKDEAGLEIPNSEKPKPRPKSNDLVEEPRSGQIPNVAYRNLKIRIPKSTAGDKIKWSMVPLFTPAGQSAPGFGGGWPTEHPDRFEANAGGGPSYGFERLSQEEARTQVDANGETAIRINLPPIGFNKAGVRLEIEKYPGATAEIIFEVPAVVVIDPGHGGTGRITDPDTGFSDGEHAVGPVSHVQEKTMALSYGLELRNVLKRDASDSDLNIKVFMTRDTDVNHGPRFRTNVARDNGADVLLSIHLNGSAAHNVRGTETWIRRPAENMNYDEDLAYAGRIQSAVFNAIHAFDPSTIDNRGIKEGGLVMTSDNQMHLGNTAQYYPIRAALVEMEFLDNPVVDSLLNGSSAQAIQTAIVQGLSTKMIEDLQSQPKVKPQ